MSRIKNTPRERLSQRPHSNVKTNQLQFGVRENTASSRQHAPRLSVSPWHQCCVISHGKLRDNRSRRWMSQSGGTFRFSRSEWEERATGEERRDANYQAITARQYRQPMASALFLRTQFRNVLKAQLDIRCTAEASDKGISAPSAHEASNEQGGLP
jgi:hypothetical protein